MLRNCSVPGTQTFGLSSDSDKFGSSSLRLNHSRVSQTRTLTGPSEAGVPQTRALIQGSSEVGGPQTRTLTGPSEAGVPQTRALMQGSSEAGVPQTRTLTGPSEAGVPQTRALMQGSSEAGVPQTRTLTGPSEAGVPQTRTRMGSSEAGVPSDSDTRRFLRLRIQSSRASSLRLTRLPEDDLLNPPTVRRMWPDQERRAI